MDRLKTAVADRYTIERELGAGGMATVYLARDLRHDRYVALKVLRPELAAILGALFHLDDELYLEAQEFYTPFDVAADGRFIMARNVTPASTLEAPLIVVGNWFVELREKLERP